MILAGKNSGPSARLIRDHWFTQTGYRPSIFKRASDCRRYDKKILVRYGNSAQLLESDQHRDLSLNKPDALKVLVDKYAVSELLLTNGFIAPKFRKDAPADEDFPLFIRTTLTAYKGKGIIPIETREEFEAHWQGYYWWCSYLPVETEYRIYVFNHPELERKIFRVSVKQLREGHVDNDLLKVRHNDHYKFSRRLTPYQQVPQICEEVEDAIQYLPGVFYALDVGWSPELGRTIFYEANTAPGLDNGSARQLVELLIKYTT